MNKYNVAVDKHKQLILDAFEYCRKNPETGFKEFKTSKYLEKAFEKLGYNIVKADDIPGFYTVIDTGKPGPQVLILAELDALICREHPDSNYNTGAAHCCGHNAQTAALLGVAVALKEQGIMDDLSGKIRICAVPAEEAIEIDYRTDRKKEGAIRYLGGKAEFLHRGYFDDVDIAFMVHTGNCDEIYINKGSVGCVVKEIEYKGKAAHASTAWEGCNALQAANLGLSAINSVRETFKESDLIRVHPIIKNGGDAVNVIPEKVVLESYVRGITFDKIKEANQKVNRALCGAAISLGANIDIKDVHVYCPLINCDNMMDVAEQAAKVLPEIAVVRNDTIGSGCSDMGDLSTLMPVVHPHIPGASGTAHGADYRISNPYIACVCSAKWQLNMLDILLKNNAARAKQIISDFKPLFVSKDEYFKHIDSLIASGERIKYNDKTAVVRL